MAKVTSGDTEGVLRAGWLDVYQESCSAGRHALRGLYVMGFSTLGDLKKNIDANFRLPAANTNLKNLKSDLCNAWIREHREPAEDAT